MIIDIAYVLFHFQKLLLKTEQKKQYTPPPPPPPGSGGIKKPALVEKAITWYSSISFRQWEGR
jgi:hypothetical protein